MDLGNSKLDEYQQAYDDLEQLILELSPEYQKMTKEFYSLVHTYNTAQLVMLYTLMLTIIQTSTGAPKQAIVEIVRSTLDLLGD